MRGERNDRWKSSAVLALAAAQLVLLLVVPVRHHAEVARSLAVHLEHARSAGPSDHTEAPGVPSGHGEACHVCRLAELRYTLPPAGAPVFAAQSGPAAETPASDVWTGRPAAGGAHGPRAPPRA